MFVLTSFATQSWSKRSRARLSWTLQLWGLGVSGETILHLVNDKPPQGLASRFDWNRWIRCCKFLSICEYLNMHWIASSKASVIIILVITIEFYPSLSLKAPTQQILFRNYCTYLRSSSASMPDTTTSCFFTCCRCSEYSRMSAGKICFSCDHKCCKHCTLFTATV